MAIYMCAPIFPLYQIYLNKDLSIYLSIYLCKYTHVHTDIFT